MHNVILAHRIFVSLFLLQYLVKLLLLLAGKKEELAKYTKATRLVEILISVAFLVTGTWLVVQPNEVTPYIIVKLICVFVAIPLAVVGFKRGNKALAALSVILIIAAYGLAEVGLKAKAGGKVDTSTATSDLDAGQKIYQEKNCVNCHGADGKQGANGAKDLSITTLTIDEQKAIIKVGKAPMPAYSDLSDEQLKQLTEYVATLRK